MRNITGRSSEACCNDKHLLSCQPASVDADLLASQDDILLDEIVLTFKSTIPPNGFVYQSPAGDEAVITLNKVTGSVFGSFEETSTGRAFAIERCSKGHVWKEFDVNSLTKDDQGSDNGDDLVRRPEAMLSRKMSSLRQLGAEDKTTQATYSVMFYYTPEFAAITADIPGFIDQMLAQTNQAYVNSEIPLTATKFCIEAATITDPEPQGSSTFRLMRDFEGMKGSSEALRNTADAAVLLASEFRHCGQGNMNAISTGETISIHHKICILPLHTFAHELGHNMGAAHNKEALVHTTYPENQFYKYGHGHLIEKGKLASSDSGYRTLMAYSAPGHKKIANYFSNPDLKYKPTGTRLGKQGVSNNARVLTENRFAMQEVGDESGTCSDGFEVGLPTTTGSQGPWTPQATTASTPVMEGEAIGF